ncbi:hypothetical protein HN51_005406 [Arachis hypogaea]|nr:uncharacterized protein DS421_4g126620 [Arachis hypogaea]
MKIVFCFSILLLALSVSFGNNQLQVVIPPTKFCLAPIGTSYCLSPSKPDACNERCIFFLGKPGVKGLCDKLTKVCVCIYSPPCKQGQEYVIE